MFIRSLPGLIVKALGFIVLLGFFIRPLSSIIVKAVGFILLSCFIRRFSGIIIKALGFIFLLGCVIRPSSGLIVNFWISSYWVDHCVASSLRLWFSSYGVVLSGLFLA